MSVDGMIIAASTTLLADSRAGRSSGALSWLLLSAGSVANLAANVAVAEPSVTGRVIVAWPSFALIGPYELLMRQIRGTAAVPSPRPARQTPHSQFEHSDASGPARSRRYTEAGRSACRRLESAAGGSCLGYRQPGRGRKAAQRQGHRGSVRPARAMGPPGQAAGWQLEGRRRPARRRIVLTP
jgi:hypothetical protein